MRSRRRPLPFVLVSRWVQRHGGVSGVLARLHRGMRA